MSYFGKENKILTKILRLTVEDKLSWELSDPPVSLIQGTDDFVPIFFHSKYKGRYIAIFEKRFRTYSDEFEFMHWSERVYFAILDFEDRILWEHSGSPVLRDLLDTVRERVAEVDDFFDELFNDDE